MLSARAFSLLSEAARLIYDYGGEDNVVSELFYLAVNLFR